MITPATGRLREISLEPVERHMAVWMHLSPALATFALGPFAGLVPLALWLSRRQASAFDDDHGREAVNMSITGALLFVIGLLTGIGVVVWLFWAVVALVNVIRGAVAASRGEYFRYPMTIRFIGLLEPKGLQEPFTAEVRKADPTRTAPTAPGPPAGR